MIIYSCEDENIIKMCEYERMGGWMVGDTLHVMSMCIILLHVWCILYTFQSNGITGLNVMLDILKYWISLMEF
jgi:hypothetical protein